MFSLLIEKAVNGDFISSYTIRGKNGLDFNFSHSLLVDDTLMLYKDSVDEMLCLCWVLICFEAISGLKVNLEKYVLFLVG